MTGPLHTTSKIPLVALGIEATAEVTGLSVRQLQRWDRNGFFEPTYADPNRRRPGSRVYSRDDIVTLRIIAKLREHGVPFAQLGSLLPELARSKNGKEPVRQIYVVRNRVYLSKDEAEVAAREAQGQSVPTTIVIDELLAELDQAIERLRERKPEEIGQVVRRRGTMGGVPIIAGTRIPTEFIASYHNEGWTLVEILENFPRLTARDVEAAIGFERERAAKVLKPASAHG